MQIVCITRKLLTLCCYEKSSYYSAKKNEHHPLQISTSELVVIMLSITSNHHHFDFSAFIYFNNSIVCVILNDTNASPNFSFSLEKKRFHIYLFMSSAYCHFDSVNECLLDVTRCQIWYNNWVHEATKKRNCNNDNSNEKEAAIQWDYIFIWTAMATCRINRAFIHKFPLLQFAHFPSYVLNGVVSFFGEYVWSFSSHTIHFY